MISSWRRWESSSTLKKKYHYKAEVQFHAYGTCVDRFLYKSEVDINLLHIGTWRYT
jgi:hypothetical protein